MTPPSLIILTNCSERKRGSGNALRLRDFKGPQALRAKRWCKSLADSKCAKTSAIDLYQGDHWAAILSLVRVAEFAGWTTEIWVASAGYGLIPTEAALVPYAATFGSGHPDSIGAFDERAAKTVGPDWWDALSKWSGPVPCAPRTLTDLAKKSPRSKWLVCMSPTYLNAISPDLIMAKSSMKDPEGLILVSGKPGPKDKSLVPNWIPALDKCRASLGGSCNSLNARVGTQLLRRFPPNRWLAATIQPEANLWMASLPPADRPIRSPLSDEEAIAFIKSALSINPKMSHSALLRELRSKGMACEQGRFRRLFQSI